MNPAPPVMRMVFTRSSSFEWTGALAAAAAQTQFSTIADGAAHREFWWTGRHAGFMPSRKMHVPAGEPSSYARQISTLEAERPGNPATMRKGCCNGWRARRERIDPLPFLRPQAAVYAVVFVAS